MATTEIEGQQLIQAIARNPDDNGPRLAYADWIEKHGDPDRARFIRVQCDLTNLRTEQDQLLAENRERWLGLLPGPGVDCLEFRRGFPECISIRPADYFELKSKIGKVTPIVDLHLKAAEDDDLIRLANDPASEQLRALGVGYPTRDPSSPDHGPRGLNAIATSPHLKSLRGLHLHTHNIDYESAMAIANGNTLTNLRQLELTGPKFRSSVSSPKKPLFDLVRSPTLDKLEYLKAGETEYEIASLNYFRSGEGRPGGSSGRGR